MTSPATGGETLDVATIEDLSYFDERDGDSIGDAEFIYTTGGLSVTAADGSRVLLNAGNGDVTTFDLTVESGGTSETITIPAERLMSRVTICNDPSFSFDGRDV